MIVIFPPLLIILLNNDSSQHSHNHNRSFIKQNVKTYFNFRNIKDHGRDYNNRNQKKIITSFVNKNVNELTKYINIKITWMQIKW